MILLDWLTETGDRSGRPLGCGAEEIRLSVRISADGKYLSHQEYAPEERIELFPIRERSNAGLPILVDDFRYTFGVPALYESSERSDEFSGSYIEMIQQIPSPAAKAVARFLSRADTGRPVFIPTSGPLTDSQKASAIDLAKSIEKVNLAQFEQIRESISTNPRQFTKKKVFPDAHLMGLACSVAGAIRSHTAAAAIVWVDAIPMDRVLIEVEGHPNWWLEPESRIPYELRMKETSKAHRGRCSLCGTKNSELTELFFRTSKKQLISFNNKSSTAYGRNRGITAPTCCQCADRMDLGFNVIDENRNLQQSWVSGGFKAFWWNPDDLSQNLWELFDRALKGEEIRFPDRTYFFMVGVNLKRLALRRHALVSEENLTERILEWQKAGMPKIGNLWSVSRLLGLPEKNGGSQKGFLGNVHERDSFRVTEDLLYHFMDGAPFSDYLKQQAQAIEWAESASKVTGYFTGFYNMKADKSQFTSRQKGAYALGAALRMIEMQAKQKGAKPVELSSGIQARIIARPSGGWYKTLSRIAEQTRKNSKYTGVPPWILEKLDEASLCEALEGGEYNDKEAFAFQQGYQYGWQRETEETSEVNDQNPE